MEKPMKKIAFKNRLKQFVNTTLDLTTEDREEMFLRIEKINFLRIRVVGYVAIILETLLIVFRDLPNLTKEDYIFELTVAYLGAHSFLLLISIAVVVYGVRHFPENISVLKKRHVGLNSAFAMFFLIGVAFIAGLDQLTNSQIVSFIAMFTIGSMMYHCKPPRQLIVFGVPTIVFVVSVGYFQYDPLVANANIVNGLLFATTMMAVSVFNYKKAQNDIAREILLEKWTEKLDFFAHHDSLTGLYNRRSFEQEILQLSESCNRELSYALGIMDLDYFKKINDIYGHDAADEVLIRIAQIMNEAITPTGIVARWGGEEFIFMLFGESFEALTAKVESIRVAIACESVKAMHQEIAVTGSFGMTQIECHEFTQLKQKFSIVDRALYESKEAGRNRVTVK